VLADSLNYTCLRQNRISRFNPGISVKSPITRQRSPSAREEFYTNRGHAVAGFLVSHYPVAQVGFIPVVGVAAQDITRIASGDEVRIDSSGELSISRQR